MYVRTMYLYITLRTYTKLYIRMCFHMYVCIHTYICMYIHTYMYVCIYHVTVYVEIFKRLNFRKNLAVSNFGNNIFENGERV